MNRFKQVKDHPSLVRDVATGSLINIDQRAFEEHKKNKFTYKQEQLKEQRINTLEKEVSEIKQGITEILKILKHGTS